MQGDNPISWLMFFTLAATVFVIAGAFIYFVRSRTNRNIAAHALQGESGSTRTAQAGAGGELVILTVLAIGVMGLLAAGYHGKPGVETAQAPTPVGGTTTGMAQPAGTAEQPKKYQPANPAPDTRDAPVGLSPSPNTGSGAANGSSAQPDK